MREMKDSGIEWIGDIPKNWNMSKIGSLYTQRNEKVSDKEYQPLSVTMQGVLPQLASAAKTDDGDNRKLVRVGDFAINSRSDRRGSCGISPLDGSVSLINIILTPRTTMHRERSERALCGFGAGLCGRLAFVTVKHHHLYMNCSA